MTAKKPTKLKPKATPSYYCRENPSQRYTTHLNDYKKMHAEGYERKNGTEVTKVAAEETYAGEQLLKFRLAIQEMIEKTGAKTMLDYGCGKGQQYGTMPIADSTGKIVAQNMKEFWGVDEITLYDPGYKKHWTLPKGQFDGVVSTDVLEHIPVEDIPWVVEEQFSYAKKFVFANIACYPALATLPDGSNAHVTVKNPEWWDGLFYSISQNKRNIKYAIVCAFPQRQADGTSPLRNFIYTNL